MGVAIVAGQHLAPGGDRGHVPGAAVVEQEALEDQFEAWFVGLTHDDAAIGAVRDALVRAAATA